MRVDFFLLCKCWVSDELSGLGESMFPFSVTLPAQTCFIPVLQLNSRTNVMKQPLEARCARYSVSVDVCTSGRSYVYRKSRKVKVRLNAIFKESKRKRSDRNLKVFAETMKS